LQPSDYDQQQSQQKMFFFNSSQMNECLQCFYLQCFDTVGWAAGKASGFWPVKNMGGWWRWALVSPDREALSRMVGVSASVNLPLHHKVQKFSPGWSGKKSRKTVVWSLWCDVVWFSDQWAPVAPNCNNFSRRLSQLPTDNWQQLCHAITRDQCTQGQPSAKFNWRSSSS